MRTAHALLLSPLLLLCGCGGGSSPAAPTAPKAVLVQPAAPTLQTGQGQAFTATVDGAPSTAVTWSVLEALGGAITSGGAYTAPAAVGTFHVQAALLADPTRKAQAVVTVVAAQSGVPGLGIGAPMNGYRPFPADNPWNQDISALPVDPASGAIIAFVGTGHTLHPDFSSIAGGAYGIPYAVVPGTQARVAVAFNVNGYGGESEPGPMPIPVPPPYEGTAPTDTSGDRHVLVLDRDSHWLYELYGAQLQGDGTWNAYSTALWDLTANTLRPYGWTSADAAGLPIFPGLAKYSEVASGQVLHALRLTVPVTRRAYVLPATHWASSTTSANAPPMGARIRLKAARDISTFGPQSQILLKALKKYGMIVADNGSSWYISGAPDPGWDDNDLHGLGAITGADLEVVQMGQVLTADPTGPAPTVTLTATPASLAAGASSTLAWTAAGATRFFLTPAPGPVRGASVAVTPTATTVYTLLAEGPYGSAMASVTVTVH